MPPHRTNFWNTDQTPSMHNLVLYAGLWQPCYHMASPMQIPRRGRTSRRPPSFEPTLERVARGKSARLVGVPAQTEPTALRCGENFRSALSQAAAGWAPSKYRNRQLGPKYGWNNLFARRFQ